MVLLISIKILQSGVSHNLHFLESAHMPYSNLHAT